MEELSHLFEQHFGMAPEVVHPVQGELGGSGRHILRLRTPDHSAIGIVYDVREENAAFLGFTRHFRSLGLPVPQIYAEDLEHGVYLMQDLGDTTLFQLLQRNREGSAIAPVALEAYRKVVAMLPRFQVLGGNGLDYKLCYPRGALDEQSLAWDLNYFKYYFLRLAEVPFSEQALQDDFDALTEFLLQAPQQYFLYRDFQSRNVMMVDGEPWFLDYQGGRRGALQYDIASLLFDAKADLPPALRAELLDFYLNELQNYLAVDRSAFLAHYYGYVYVRIFQALGAYGFRGYFERKPHFLASVPYAVKNLAWLLQHAELPVHLPALTAACHAIVASEKLQAIAPAAVDLSKPLHVQVTSFSFHRGLPADDSGHGGGFVFDARSLPNPGRLEQYKRLTGKDVAVAEYLSRQPAADQYFAHALALVEASVHSYQARGFDHLSVSFGCTGGQHRSVFLAEKLARQLRGKAGVEVKLWHRELERMHL